jgi:hypothetical protein
VERGLATVRFAQAFRRFQLLCNCAFPFSRLARRPSHHGSIRSQQLALMLPLLSAASEHVCQSRLPQSAHVFCRNLWRGGTNSRQETLRRTNFG